MHYISTISLFMQNGWAAVPPRGRTIRISLTAVFQASHENAIQQLSTLDLYLYSKLTHLQPRSGLSLLLEPAQPTRKTKGKKKSLIQLAGKKGCLLVSSDPSHTQLRMAHLHLTMGYCTRQAHAQFGPHCQ